VRVFFFSTEEVANLGDASLGVVERPTKERRQREAACSVRAVLAFFVFRPDGPVTKRLNRQGVPSPNGSIGKVHRYHGEFGLAEPKLNREQRRALRQARRLAKQQRNTPIPAATMRDILPAR
jgi:hypothetical protein